MKLIKAIRKFLKLPLTLPMKIGFIRRRMAFELKQHWFSDLGIVIPLTEGFNCPILELDSFWSFSEIFATGEYGSLLQDIPLPSRWIDLGCHTGYFSLYLAWQNALAGGGHRSALLIDADPRMEALAKATIKTNGLEQECTILSGLISKHSGERDFALRSGMGSSVDMNVGGIGDVARVRTISPAEILKAFPPPYDLIKIDIEGGEYDFLEHYNEVYTKAAYVLLEWHSHDREGSEANRAQEALTTHGFQFVKTVRPRRELLLDGNWYSSGVQLYQRAGGGA
jgi:FkbM family methyltransferase